MKVNQRCRDPHSRILKSPDREKIAMEKEVTKLKIQRKKKEDEIELHKKKEKISRQRFQQINKRRGYRVTDYEKEDEKKTKHIAELQAKNRVLEDDNSCLERSYLQKTEEFESKCQVLEADKIELQQQVKDLKQQLETSEFKCSLHETENTELKESRDAANTNVQSLTVKISHLEQSHQADKMQLEERYSILESENAKLMESRNAADAQVRFLTDEISRLERVNLQRTEEYRSHVRQSEFRIRQCQNDRANELSAYTSHIEVMQRSHLRLEQRIADLRQQLVASRRRRRELEADINRRVRQLRNLYLMPFPFKWIEFELMMLRGEIQFYHILFLHNYFFFVCF